MSSPIAKDKHTQSERRLIGLHQEVSHKHRVEILTEHLVNRIDPQCAALCLDIGCGGMEITSRIQALRPKLQVIGMDLYPETRLQSKGLRWENYRQFDGESLPFADGDAAYALLIDALHHMPPQIQAKILRESLRVSRKVIIKDHFEYGPMSRSMLRAMDFIGNWAYGVSVPKKYFNIEDFRALVTSCGGEINELSIGVDLYAHLPGIRWIARPKWQFLAVVESSSSD